MAGNILITLICVETMLLVMLAVGVLSTPGLIKSIKRFFKLKRAVKRKNKAMAYLIGKGKEVEDVLINVNAPFFEYKNKNYIIDRKSIYFYAGAPSLFYREENTAPIDMSELAPSVDSKFINDVLRRQKMAAEMSGKKNMMLTMYACFAAAGISLLCAVFIFKLQTSVDDLKVLVESLRGSLTTVIS